MDKGAEPRCPFVYSNGRRCCGTVYNVRFYGNPKYGSAGVRKIRMWCSDKDDHAGTVSSWVSKERMEFYPDKVSDDLRDFVWRAFEAQQPIG